MDRATLASKELHSASNKYGASSNYFKPNTMKSLLTIEKALGQAQKVEAIGSFLDHGTGQGGLVQLIKNNHHLNIEVHGYDPCVAQFSEKPSQAFDIVSSIDVLEHISRENLSNTLFEISELTRKFFFFCIDLLPASKKLLDGRNAHILLAPPEWWVQQIKYYFPIMNCIEVGATESGDRHPMHLFGCATHSMKHFDSMNEFLKGVEIANRQWILNSNGVLSAIPFQ